MIRNLNKSKFDNFDPNNYDPSLANRYNGYTKIGSPAGSFTQDATPGNKMQVNLTLSNLTATDLTLEIFSWLDSMTKRRKADYATGLFQYIPQDSYEGILAIAGAAPTDGTVGFDQNGTLVVRGAPAAATATVSCKEIAYRSFFDASGVTAFQVAYLRVTMSNDPQIDETITYFEKTFSGGIKENPISPRAYFKPTQFQNNTIDITVSFSVGIDKGLRTLVLAGQSVKINLFIQAWTLQTLS